MTKFEFNDVANYQPDTLAYFQGLKAKGSGAAIVKITQGTGYINPKATNQVNHADQAGLKTAGYHYAMFGGNVANAHAEAKYFLAQASARLAKGSILALDYEDAGTTGTNKNANANAIIAFMQDIKNAGFIPWFYTGKYFINAHVNHAAVNKAFPNVTWIAGYPGTSYPDFNYFPSVEGVIAWQYTNNWKSLGLDGSTLLLDWSEGKSAVQNAANNGNGEAVWVHNGLWYTDKAFTKKANGRIRHMGQYWTFVGGKVTETPATPKPANEDQILHKGEHFKARPAYRVDAIKKVNGIWQVVNFELAGGKDINWTANGFGVDSVDEVNKNGKKTINQTLAIGDYFRLHSDRIKVEDVDGNGIALSTRYGNVWVDAGTLTEVK
ncbi:GH25 family lysozyme [Weissella paramesenteroides]|uniref:GH25 family lysozyme n=1 Tax=Weissella paramesenteroides TaxID=1249 RepID=UPI0023A99C33|nr:GH25 family lysozyme [Weissella paramesenteroides]WEA53394.1 GH25 family lysozyme [Weissella paramesenteroides]